MFSLLTHVRSWFSNPWKSLAVQEAEQRLANLERQVKDNQQRIHDIATLKTSFSPMFEQMKKTYSYFLELLEPTQRTSRPIQTKDAQSDFIQRVKQMKTVVSIIIATHESEQDPSKNTGPLSILGNFVDQAQTQLHEKRMALAKLQGRMQGFKTVAGQLDQFITDTKKAHAALNAETKRIQRLGTPPPKCRSGSGIGIQTQP